MVTWVLYLCIGIVIGGMAGFYFAKMDDFSRKQKRNLEEKLQKSEQELIQYKDQVTTHFRETATLINNMTESYQKVHEHLSHGVAQLCSNPIEVNKLQVSPNQLLANSAEAAITEKAESEAPKAISQEEKNKNKDSAARTTVSAADSAETVPPEETPEVRLSDTVMESPEINPVDSPVKSQAISDQTSDSAVTPPDSTTKQATADAETPFNPPDMTETMAVADETEDSEESEEKSSKKGSKKVRLPGSRTVH